VTDLFSDNLRFWRALVTRPKHVGAVAPSSRALGRAMARQIDPARSGPVLELGPGTGVMTAALLEHGIAPERLTCVEYDPELASALAARFAGVHVIEGDAFDLARTLGTRHSEAFAGVLSGLPLLNFPMKLRRALIDGALARLAPGAPLVQFSYGMHAPVVPPAGHSVVRTALIWANLPPARVWVYRKI